MNSSNSHLQSYSCYRGYLRSHLAQRQLELPQYSLRTFAADLGISSSTLSEVMAGRHGLSRLKAQTVSRRLGLNEEEVVYFCDLVESVDGRSLAARSAAKERLADGASRHGAKRLSEDVFSVIADWYHLAIVELVSTSAFNGKAESIPKLLNITAHQAAMAVERLCKLGILSNKGGRLRTAAASTSTLDDIPSAAVQQFQKQILQKAQQALATQAVDKREIASMILSIREEDLPEAKRALKEFRRRFVREIEERSEQRNEVYCLSMAFFSLQSGIGQDAFIESRKRGEKSGQ